jgi:hypothetical protein
MQQRRRVSSERSHVFEEVSVVNWRKKELDTNKLRFKGKVDDFQAQFDCKSLEVEDFFCGWYAEQI